MTRYTHTHIYIQMEVDEDDEDDEDDITSGEMSDEERAAARITATLPFLGVDVSPQLASFVERQVLPQP